MTNILNLPTYRAKVRTISHDQARAAVKFESGTPPVPLPLTGITFRAQLRASVNDATAALEISSDDGSIFVGGEEDAFLGFVIEEERMARLAPGSYVFDVIAVADGAERTVIRGEWEHERRVTR